MINNNEKVIDYLTFFNKTEDQLIKFILRKKSNEILFDRKLVEEENVKKHTNEVIEKDYYFSEIAYIESYKKMEDIKKEEESFKNKEGELYTALKKIDDEFTAECKLKASQLNERNNNFFDPEDKFLNIKETCDEIFLSEFKKQQNKETLKRIYKQKEDKPILITYSDIYKFRLKESFFLWIYIFCLTNFLYSHNFSKVGTSMEKRVTLTIENIIFKNPYTKNLLLRKEDGKFLTNRENFLIFFSVILNNLFTDKNYTSTDELNLGFISDNDNFFLKPNNLAEFNFRFAKRKDIILCDDKNNCEENPENNSANVNSKNKQILDNSK